MIEGYHHFRKPPIYVLMEPSETSIQCYFCILLPQRLPHCGQSEAVNARESLAGSEMAWEKRAAHKVIPAIIWSINPVTCSCLMVKRCHKPPVTGNGNHTTYKNGEIGGWCKWHCFTYILWCSMPRKPNSSPCEANQLRGVGDTWPTESWGGLPQ